MYLLATDSVYVVTQFFASKHNSIAFIAFQQTQRQLNQKRATGQAIGASWNHDLLSVCPIVTK